MWSLISLFYNTQETHKLLIHQSYNDLKTEIIRFNKIYPGGYNPREENETTKKDWEEYFEKTKKLKNILINNLLYYCKNYPDDKISKHRFINEHEEYPYRLEQNFSEVILDL